MSYEDVSAVFQLVDDKVVESGGALSQAAGTLTEAYGSLYEVSEGSAELGASAAQMKQAYDGIGDAMQMMHAALNKMGEYAALQAMQYQSSGNLAAIPDGLQAPAYISDPPAPDKPKDQPEPQPESDPGAEPQNDSQSDDGGSENQDNDNLTPTPDYDADELDVAVVEQTAGHVQELDFNSVVQPQEGGTTINTDGFSFTTIQGTVPEVHSLEAAGNVTTNPSDVIVPTSNPDDIPYIDANQAIGLTKTDEYGRPVLIAIAAAGMSEHYTDTLIINQIQAHAPSNQTKKERYTSGLYSGFDWRKTMVAAWEATAKKMGIPRICIQSAENNRWRVVSGKLVSGAREPRYKAYDDVAKSMGYTRDPVTGNWFKKL